MARKSQNTDNAAPAYDLAALAQSARPVEMPARTRTVTSDPKWANNPFVEPLRATVGQRHGQEITVPRVAVSEVTAGLRDAGNKVTDDAGEVVGVSTRYRVGETVYGGVKDIPEDAEEVTVLFSATSRRRRITKEQQEEARSFGSTFVGENGKIDREAYFAWIDSGRPMGDDAPAGE